MKTLQTTLSARKLLFALFPPFSFYAFGMDVVNPSSPWAIGIEKDDFLFPPPITPYSPGGWVVENHCPPFSFLSSPSSSTSKSSRSFLSFSSCTSLCDWREWKSRAGPLSSFFFFPLPLLRGLRVAFRVHFRLPLEISPLLEPDFRHGKGAYGKDRPLPCLSLFPPPLPRYDHPDFRKHS